MLCIIGCLATSLASIQYCDKEKCLWIFVCPRGQPPSPTEKQTYTINNIQFEITFIIEEAIVFLIHKGQVNSVD